MRLLAAEVRASLLELLRYPAYSSPTLLFPATLYLVVAGRSRVDPAARMVGFAAIAVLGVAFFQFGVGIAHERSRPWERYLRTLPASPSARVLGRVLSALIFACASAGAVVLAAGAKGVALPGSLLGAFAGALLLGAVPFALLGVSIGYAVPARAAIPLANLLYLPLAYLGGLWSGPRAPPHLPAALPTRSWADLVWAAAGERAFSISALVALATWTGVFGLTAVWCYRRDEGERFS